MTRQKTDGKQAIVGTLEDKNAAEITKNKNERDSEHVITYTTKNIKKQQQHIASSYKNGLSSECFGGESLIQLAQYRQQAFYVLF